MKKRILYQKVWTELSQEKSLILMAGPRQAGKTTLAQIIADSFTNSLYFNWDIPEHRTSFLRIRIFLNQSSARMRQNLLLFSMKFINLKIGKIT